MAFREINLSELNGENGFVINGVNRFDNSGRSVSNAGDINGDGIADLIIGAPDASDNYNNEGQSYVVFGSREGFDASLNLAELDGSNGFAINGVNRFDNSGRSVSSAGDINGDGIDDLIIGAPYAGQSSPYGDSDRRGESYVVFGSKAGFDASLNLAELDGTNGFALNGVDRNDNSGYSVSSAGDINGDGIADLIIGAPNAGISDNYSNEGQSYVVFGSRAGFDASLNLADLDGTNGFALDGVARFDNSGRSVSSAGDINGDGIDDLIIGAPNASDNYSDQGQSYVVFGSRAGFDASLNLADLNGTNGFALDGVARFDNSGRSVSSAGDINGDGIDDLIIGAPYAGQSSPYGDSDRRGESYVVFGSRAGFDASFELRDLLPENGGDGTKGFVIQGIARDDNSGRSVSSAGDINGDGLADLIIGAPNAGDSYGSGPGQAYVIFGSSGGFGPTLDLATFDGNGLLITGINTSDNLGFSVSSAGDLNGDGADDLIVGAPRADANGNSDAGQSYVIFGVVPLELIGTEDDDILTGGNGDDFIDGRGGDDILQGEGGNDQILGDSGDDLINGGDGGDTIDGGAGRDNISGDAGNDSITGGDGRDDIQGGDGNDSLDGGEKADRLLGGEGNDQIDGGSGRDILLGKSGDDTLSGDGGADTINGGTGNDLALGGKGADRISGGNGDDSLFGEAGKDKLIGGSGDDNLDGGNCIDWLVGVDNGAGSRFGTGEVDTLTGGSGSDTFVLGDENRVYYDDGDPLSRGESDFALITEFNERKDFIQLKGSPDEYILDFFTSGGTTNADLIFDTTTARGEIIATLENVSTDLSLSDPNFIFV